MVKASQRLYKARLRKKVSLEEVARATKIKAHFLAAIERGEYSHLPSSAYAEGFVKNYAEYLGLPKSEIMPLFRREFDEKKAYKVLPDALVKKEEFPINRIRLQQSIVAVAGLFLIFLLYLFSQYRAAFLPPSLQVSSPKEKSINAKELTVKGKADSDATVLVNGEPAAIASNGEFSKNIVLFPGKTTIEVKAKNRYGKETVVEREIIVK